MLLSLIHIWTGRPRKIGGRHVRKEEEGFRESCPEGLRKAHEARAGHGPEDAGAQGLSLIHIYEQKQHDEDFETRVAMATTDLGLLTILTVLLDQMCIRDSDRRRNSDSHLKATRIVEKISST